MGTYRKVSLPDEVGVDLLDDEDLSLLNKFVKSPTSTTQGLPLALQEVCFTYQTRKLPFWKVRTPVLHGVSACVEPGQMMLLTGPSGSGKSTLLDVIALRIPRGITQGAVTIAGQRPKKQFVRRFVSYMQQHDSLFGALTVQEMLMYQAALVLPGGGKNNGFAQRSARVEQLLQLLQLLHVRHRLCSALSKGSMRRTSLALALLPRPKLLLLDEPLMANDAYVQDNLLQVLRTIVSHGNLSCVAAITQPTSQAWSSFDRLLMLADGRTLYCGAVGSTAIQYWESQVKGYTRLPGDSQPEYAIKLMKSALTNVNAANMAVQYTASEETASARERVQVVADMVVDTPIEEEDEGDAIGAGVRTSSGGHGATTAKGDASSAAVRDTELESPDAFAVEGSASHKPWSREVRGRKRTKTSALRGFGTLWYYRGLRNYTSFGWLLPRFLDKLVFAAVLAILFQDAGSNVQVSMFFTVPILNIIMITIPMFSAVALVSTMFEEREALHRETAEGLYSITTYLAYRMTEELLFASVYSVGIAALVFYVVQLQGSFVLYVLVYTLNTWVAVAFALLVAVSCKRQGAATIWVPTIAWLCLFFAGGLIGVQLLPAFLRWLPYIDPLRYSFVALQANHWNEVQEPIIPFEIEAKIDEVVANLVSNLPDDLNIPLLKTPAPPSPGRAPPSFVGGLVNSVTNVATGVVTDVVSGATGSVAGQLSGLAVNWARRKLNETIENRITNPTPRVNATMQKLMANPNSLTYSDVAAAMFDFRPPYDPWINWLCQIVWFVGISFCTYVVMFIQHNVL